MHDSCDLSVYALRNSWILVLDQYGISFSIVDEYIAIAKEKHGYNMEQVTTYLEKLFMLFAFLYRIV